MIPFPVQIQISTDANVLGVGSPHPWFPTLLILPPPCPRARAQTTGRIFEFYIILRQWRRQAYSVVKGNGYADSRVGRNACGHQLGSQSELCVVRIVLYTPTGRQTHPRVLLMSDMSDKLLLMLRSCCCGLS